MESIAAVIFNVESEGYQAFTRLEQSPITDHYAVSQFNLVKREGDRLVPCNQGDSGMNTNDDTLYGLLVGSLVGIIGGPLGVLLGGAWGATLGIAADAYDMVDNASMIEMITRKIYDGEVALIALVQEDEANTSAFDALFDGMDCTIIRYDAAEIAVEVEEARAAERELQRQARQNLKAQKKANRKQKAEDHRASIKASFENFKAKFE